MIGNFFVGNISVSNNNGDNKDLFFRIFKFCIRVCRVEDIILLVDFLGISCWLLQV